MAKSKQSIVLTRREALLLSTTAGLGAALGMPAFGSDSVKTGAHQEPGMCRRRQRRWRRRSTARCAGL